MLTYSARRRAAALIATVALGLGASACSWSDDSDKAHGAHGSSSQSDARSADVTFAQEMIPHHRQALEMAALAPGRAGAEVTALAARISAAQDPEIETLTRWLKERGEKVPSADDAEAGAHGEHGTEADADADADADGMMSPADLVHLASLSGEAFDEEFLRQMIAHHEGAITMAEDALRDGTDPEISTLAQQISDAQRAEVDEMQDMAE